MKVYKQGQRVILKPYGFLRWTTEEVVGTPGENPELIAFVNAKSTKAKTGIMVHFTAPTINSGWKGKIVLELVNLGPFTFVLKPGDAIAQLTVARITSRPDPGLRNRKKKSHTTNQVEPGGSSGK
jgi:dCTP deaminase